MNALTIILIIYWVVFGLLAIGYNGGKLYSLNSLTCLLFGFIWLPIDIIINIGWKIRKKLN